MTMGPCPFFPWVNLSVLTYILSPFIARCGIVSNAMKKRHGTGSDVAASGGFEVLQDSKAHHHTNSLGGNVYRFTTLAKS